MESSDGKGVQFNHPIYEIDSTGALRNKQTQAKVTDGELAAKGEELLNAVVDYVQTLMKKELGFQEIWIPHAEAEAKCEIFASKSFESAKKLLVFLSSSKGLRPGIWSRSLVVRAGLKSGSMLPYLKAAEKEGYGIVIMNPNASSVILDQDTDNPRKVMIEHSSSQEEHVLHVWDTYIKPSQAKQVSFVAYGYGGVLVKRLLSTCSEEIGPRLGGIVFIESSHRVEDSDSAAVKQILAEKAIYWESSSAPFGATLSGAAPNRSGCACFSAGKPDRRRSGEGSNAAYTIEIVMRSTLEFLQSPDTKQFASRITPGAGGAAVGGPVTFESAHALDKKPSIASQNTASTPSVPQGSEKQCNICGFAFTLFDRRHHCRMCHRAVCNACSPDRLFLPGASTAQRVCVQCVAEGKPRSSTSSAAGGAVSPADAKKETLTIDDFDLLKVVGKGAFGKVMLVKKKEGAGADKIYAMKVLKKQAVFEKNQVEHTKAERRILRDIDHPYVVRLRFAFQSDDKLYLVMDYFAGGSLFFHLRRSRRFDEDRARLYAAELVLGLGHLHSLDIAYRDLKLENILMDAEGHVALTDFGLSKENVDLPDGATTFCGTAEYIAPELLKGKAYGKAVDWWSFGTLLYEMITGQTPFFDRNRKKMFHNILYKEVQFSPLFSPDCQSLLLGLLRRDPQKRLGSGPSGVQEIMDQPFFQSIDWEKLKHREISAPFIPSVSGETDVSNVANVFTRELPKDTPCTTVLGTTQKAQQHFDGFTYIGDSELDK